MPVLSARSATPPGTGTGVIVHTFRPCSVTVRPPIAPTADPNTTSLSQCRLSCSRDAATYDAIVYPSTEYRQPRCRSMTVAVANVIDACPEGNECELLPSGRSRCVAYLRPTVRP